MQVGDVIEYQAEPGQLFEGGLRTAPAAIQEFKGDGLALVMVRPEGGEPFTALVGAAPTEM